jgi:hypothetical protein
MNNIKEIQIIILICNTNNKNNFRIIIKLKRKAFNMIHEIKTIIICQCI